MTAGLGAPITQSGIGVLQLVTELEQDTADKLGLHCLAAVDAQESARTLLTHESNSF